jgi:hypothetical protein
MTISDIRSEGAAGITLTVRGLRDRPGFIATILILRSRSLGTVYERQTRAQTGELPTP